MKSAFLNGFLNEEVYIEQPKEFIHPSCPQHVYKIQKALYGLKQAPRAYYDRLEEFLIHKGYFRGGSDITLFIKQSSDGFIIAQVYIDDIVFRGSPKALIN